jgi:uncharacterized membrane protein
MFRFLYACLLGIIGAAIIHIVIVLLVPTYSDQNAWSKVSQLGESYQFHDLAKLQHTTASPDPYFMEAACRFELDDQAVHIYAEGLMPFWSVSIYNRQGDNLLNFNDSISENGDLDLIIAPLSLSANIREKLAEVQSNSVLIEQELREGIVRLRIITPDASWNDLAKRTINTAKCAPLRD